MKLFNIFKKKPKDEPMVEVAKVYAPPPVDEDVNVANARHKIRALREGPAAVLGTPFRSMSPAQFKDAMKLTMAQVHLGPGYTEQLVDDEFNPKETN